MDNEVIVLLSQLRLVIGYLGERDQFSWWQSSFFTQGSGAFLAPLFSRTQILAQCNGVTRAAALVHDERIGVGHVYHLFRLPEDIEQGIHQVLQQEALTKKLKGLVANKEVALAYIDKVGMKSETLGVGPTRVGNVNDLRNQKFWLSVAGYYLAAFKSGQEIFPYFTDTI